MAAAAALSKVGHKVLVLEQYRTLGGLTHSFSREGFTWDAGIHYLSGIAPGDRERVILDWLSDTPIEFTSMGAVYDNLHIGDAPPLPLSRPYEVQERDVKDRFPEGSESNRSLDGSASGRPARQGKLCDACVDIGIVPAKRGLVHGGRRCGVCRTYSADDHR